MNESDQLLVMTLNQMGCLPKDKKIEAISQIEQKEFGFIIVDVCNKIINMKNMDIQFPKKFSYDMSKKYQYSQKIVDLIKSLGYIGDINLNNILFPSLNDMKKIFDFTIEILTSGEENANETDFTQNLSAKNVQKMKFGKTLTAWSKKVWIIPELSKNLYQKKKINQNEFCLKFENSKMAELKKVKSSYSSEITGKQGELAKTISNSLQNAEHICFIQDEDNALLKYTAGEKNHNYFIEKIKEKNNTKPVEKGVNQYLFEILNTRNTAIEFIYDKFKENNFKNNVKILQKMNHNLYKEILLAEKRQMLSRKNKTGGKDGEEFESEEEKKQKTFKNKLEEMLHNFEEEKQKKNEEITELNNKLLSLMNHIDKCKNDYDDNIELKKNYQSKLEELSEKNKELLREIEDQMNAYEQMKRLQNNEIKEKEVIEEVEQLENKYNDMISNWNEYSTQAKNRINELKNEIETKKKEYNYKYEQINTLKKEIEEIQRKIEMKSELAQFLNDEYQRIPSEVNRNTYTSKISEMTKKIADERKKILDYLNEQKTLDESIKKVNDNIKRVDNELEDIIFQDAKKNEKLKDVYAAFIKLRDGFNQLQKNIVDTSVTKDKLNGLENKVTDYKIKLQNYDMQQLQEQVNYLKNSQGGY